MEPTPPDVLKSLWAPYEAFLRERWEAPRPLHIAGLKGGARSFWAAALYQTAACPMLFLLPDEETAQKLVSDLRLLLGEIVHLFPSRSEGSATQQHLRQVEQIFLLSRWLEGEPLILCAPVQTLGEPLPHPTQWVKHRLRLEVGSAIERDFLLELLTLYEFTETDKVNSPGEFAWRGGVVDVFSYAHPQPLRLRIEGDTLARMQFFSVETQLSQGEVERAWLLPAPSYLEDPPTASLFDFLPQRHLLVLIEGQHCLAQLQRHGLASQGSVSSKRPTKPLSWGTNRPCPPPPDWNTLPILSLPSPITLPSSTSTSANCP